MAASGRYDCVIVGGGVAGLSAALVLGRSLRQTLVLDAGEPRNAPSSGVHGFFSRDGIRPDELLKIGREQLEPYPSVETRRVRAIGAKVGDGDLEVALEDGTVVGTRKIVLATGVVDELPETPGFRELWGKGVYHCPYCHGWEVQGRPLAVLNSTEMAAGHATMVRNWSRDLILLTDGPAGLGGEARDKLRALGVPIREGKISRLESEADGGLKRIVFEDGSELEREGLFYLPPQRQSSDLAATLGCEIVAMGPAPAVVKSDPTTRETTMAGVYVAGDAGGSGPAQSAVLAASAGASASYFLNHALAAEDAEAEARVSSKKADVV